METITENGTFQKRSPEWNFLKTLFSLTRVGGRKRNFSKTLTSHYQFQSTQRNIIHLFKMADRRFNFLVFNTWAYFRPNCLFSSKFSWLFLLADYSRRRQNIIRLLSLPVSRGGRLKWLGGCTLTPRRFCVRHWCTSAWWDNFLTQIDILKTNTHAPSMCSMIIVKKLSYTCGRAKTMRKRYAWTQIVLKTEKKSCVFKRIRIRVDGT